MKELPRALVERKVDVDPSFDSENITTAGARVDVDSEEKA